MMSLLIIGIKIMFSSTADQKAKFKDTLKLEIKKISKILQQPLSTQNKEEDRSSIPRKPIPIPKSTHKKAGVTVIVAVKRKKPATIPMIMLAITDLVAQFNVHSQLF